MRQKHVIVVGGGASGLVAAITAARGGAQVTILEQKDRVGKKILSTGNGRCNFTNACMKEEYFRGDETTIVAEVLRMFGYREAIAFFENLGVISKNRNGYMYPISDQASTILDVLSMEVKRLGISVRLNEKVIDVKPNSKGFFVKTNQGMHEGDAVILASGGKAASVLGSDGSGYALAKSLGHTLSPVVPALVQLKCKGDFFKQLAGVRTQAKVDLYVEDQLVATDVGELQLTNYGISGIPVFQVSRFAAKALYYKKHTKAVIDFFPSMDQDAFWNCFTERLKHHSTKTAEEFLIGMFHKKLIGVLLKEAGIRLRTPVSEISQKQWQQFSKMCKHFELVVEATNDFEQAQVCAGGVRTTEIDHATMESIYVKNLYLIGELIDIDGICGGYNLHWAWATGYLAGQSAARTT